MGRGELRCLLKLIAITCRKMIVGDISNQLTYKLQDISSPNRNPPLRYTCTSRVVIKSGCQARIQKCTTAPRPKRIKAFLKNYGPALTDLIHNSDSNHS